VDAPTSLPSAQCRKRISRSGDLHETWDAPPACTSSDIICLGGGCTVLRPRLCSGTDSSSQQNFRAARRDGQGSRSRTAGLTRGINEKTNRLDVGVDAREALK